MKKYYDAENLMLATSKFRIGNSEGDTEVPVPWISKFIGEEISYGLNKPVTYASKTGDSDIEKDIAEELEHYFLNHDQKIMKELEIYSKCFVLFYYNKRSQLCEKILNPTNSIAYFDDDGDIERFIYFYNKPFDMLDNVLDTNGIPTYKYHNVYYPNGDIEIYRNGELISKDMHPLKCMPVSYCEIDIADTIFSKCRYLVDAYEELLTNQQCLISEYKNAYMTVCSEGVSMESLAEMAKLIKNDEAGIIFYPHKDAKPEWLIKNINDTAIKNQLAEIKENLYAQSGHIDFNEKLSSNISGVALQSRLTGLDQRVNMILNAMLNVLYDRVKFLCDAIETKKNREYDHTDIRITTNVDIPVDSSARTNEVVQAGNIISHRTKLERLPYVENVSVELDRIKEEQKEAMSLNVDKLNEAFYGAGGNAATDEG